ncbi:DUF4118 domain-containing protein [Nocardioides euryhalodurans]|nr:DUF4118 domain-containing protein [Nocardioides euryhalodurans]
MAATGRIGAEAALVFAAGAASFALSSLLLGALLPHSPVVVVGVVILDVAAVLAAARFWGINFAVTVGIASVVALDWYFIPPVHPLELPDAKNAFALSAYLVAGVLLGELAITARRRAVIAERARSLLAEEQAALRRVATLVARETSPSEVFAAVTEEVGRLLSIDLTALLHYETDGTGTVVAAWSAKGRPLRVGARLVLTGDDVAVEVRQAGRPARMDTVAEASGPLSERLRELGVQSSAGSPVVVDGQLWGVMVAASVSEARMPAGTESRLSQFTELAATAVANAQTRAELNLSRARIVTSADQARRQIERNLHDGVQQRLVSLGLGVRVVEDIAGPDSDVLPALGGIREGIMETLEELREISHGIHPAILSEGGLRPALGNVARRSPVPVELDVRGPDRPPEAVEVGIYYVVSETLANVAKHARASRAWVEVDFDPAVVRVTVRDDGRGGADMSNGSGLVGLSDRVHALGGTVAIDSPIGHGTSIRVLLPLPDDTRSSLGAQTDVAGVEDQRT